MADLNDLDRITEICIKYEISYDQFMLLYGKFMQNYEPLWKYWQARKDINKIAYTTESLVYLENKGYIGFFGTPGEYRLLDIIITDKFSKELWIESWEAGTQLFNAYPKYLSAQINGEWALAKSCDVDLYIQKYAKKIGSDVKLHEKIILAVEKAVKMGQIREGIAKFIDGMPYSYKVLFDLKEGGGFSKMG